MKIALNPDKEYVAEIKVALENNNGYCPCRLEHTPDTKCMCKEFIDMYVGICQCGLYIKEKD